MKTTGLTTRCLLFSAAAMFIYSCKDSSGLEEKVSLKQELLSDVKLITSSNTRQVMIISGIPSSSASYTASNLYNFYYQEDSKKTTILQYQVGDANCPLIISAAHGTDSDVMSDSPVPFWASWNNKSKGTLISDFRTTHLALDIAQEFRTLTGKRPHVIINQIHRSKMDPNQTPDKLDSSAAKAYRAFHKCLDIATAKVDAAYKTTGGLLLDVHGHGHTDAAGNPTGIAEIGYNVTKETYQRKDVDAHLNETYLRTSIASLKSFPGNYTFAQRLKGQNSLGDLLEDNNVKSIPSPLRPAPVYDFFPGGDIIRFHGSMNKQRKTSAIQIEFPYVMRSPEANRKAYAKRIAKALVQYLEVQYNMNL